MNSACGTYLSLVRCWQGYWLIANADETKLYACSSLSKLPPLDDCWGEGIAALPKPTVRPPLVCTLGMATLSDPSVRSPSARCCRSGFHVLQVRRFVDSSAQSCQSSSTPPTMSATAAPKAPGSIAVIRPSMLPSSGLPNTPRYGRASLGQVQCGRSGPKPKSAWPVHRCFRCFVQHVVWQSSASVLLHGGACGLCSSPCASLRAGLLFGAPSDTRTARVGLFQEYERAEVQPNKCGCFGQRRTRWLRSTSMQPR